MENSTATPIAKGLSAQQWVDLLKGNKACTARKALNYLDGQQEAEIEKLLSDPHKGRRGWKQRGIIARTRNITKMIVEKSAQLFKDQPPTFEVYNDGSDVVNEADTQSLNDELYKIEWQEFFINVDQVVRLLKTAIVLSQYNGEDQQLELDILHRGNSAVMVNPVTRGIDALIYITSEDDGVATYRVITADEFIDLMEVKTGNKSNVTVTAQNINPYGLVPATVFYDTTVPRSGFWNEPTTELVGLNELVNLHITDSEYAISWAKLPTLFIIDCEVSGQSTVMEVVSEVGSSLPRQVATEQVHTGGPSRAIQLMSNGGGAPSVQYLSPTINIEPLDTVVDGWIKSFAADWSVRIKTAGEGSASSGFQLVVEELPNLDLRKQRQRMFEAGFKRFYRIFKTVMGVATGKTFSTTGELFVEFADPNLPTDTKISEEVWTMRINENRATVIDYLMDTQGLSKDEAIIKWNEIKQFNAVNTTTEPSDITPDGDTSEDDSSEDDDTSEDDTPTAE
jgi:hypothetical protein